MASAREVRDMDGRDVPLVGRAPAASAPEERRSMEDEASWWSRLTFTWQSGLIAEGYRRERARQRGGEAAEGQDVALTEADLFELRTDDRPGGLGEQADASWSVEEAKPPDARSLRNALWRAFRGPFVLAGCFKIVYDSLQMVGPYVLQELLGYLHSCENGDCNVVTGLQWAAVICVSNLVQTAFLHQYFHRCFRTGMRLNAAAIGLIYKKSLKISGPGKAGDASKQNGGAASANGAGAAAPAAPQQQRTSGEIVNLMSVDANRLQETCTYVHTLWSGPYQIVITLIFLFRVVSWATFAGLAVMMLQVPLVSVISRRVKLAQRKLMKVKDERIKTTNEVFGSVRLLKMYGWEESFERRVTDIRNRELELLRQYQLLNIISSAFFTVAPILTGVATFSVYTALGNQLEAKTAFAALSLFGVLRFPLTMFPNMVTSAVEANVALKRIEDFLASPEIKGRPLMPAIEWASPEAGVAIRLSNAKFDWPGGVPLLSGVSFTVPAATPTQARAHLTVILGSVGVGKSGLLQALIGDLGPASGPGSISVAGRIAYSSQVAWIRNATVKDNITFNSPLDEQRYAEVVGACQLRPDFEALPQGDATEIGEKGVNLSGGQKQRVSLARAVYANADILLLDDPLSAVDSHVAKKLIKMLRSPLVNSSSIVLCTHYLGAIRHADQVVLLERVGQGTPPPGTSFEASPAPSTPPPTTEARVAFSGSVQEFCARFPDMAAHGEDQPNLSRQDSEEAPGAGGAKAADKEAGRLVQREIELTGSVSWSVYKTYINAAGGMGFAALVVLGLIFGQACQTGADSWISFWADHSGEDEDPHVSSTLGIVGYVVSSLLAFGGVIGTSAMFRVTALRAAKSFHSQLLQNMLRLPMTFFDVTPLGRVLNRFSKDVYTIDEQLVGILMMYFNTLCRVFATIVVISFATPWFLVIIIPLLGLYRFTMNYYVPSSRQLKRIESNLRTPIFSHFSETLDGVASIRAFGQQAQFIAETTGRVQRNMRAYYMNVSSNRWLAIRLETLGTAIVTVASLLAVAARKQISPGIAGLSITYALSVTQALNWVVRMTSDRETNIVSVERVAEYIAEPTEPPRHLDLDPAPNAWPTAGRIEFAGVQLRYRPGLPLVLNGLNLTIEAGEKIGICGRTGAGKSSLLNVLLRIVDPEGGRTFIDGVDIVTLGLHRLRRSITVLPQDPVLFAGTLRFNLDPLGESGDTDVWQALTRAHLDAHARALAASSAGAGDGAQAGASISACLDAVVAEKGENFSLGQRQQACLARALLRSNKLLLLDEATSAVDVETDALIQETIRAEFRQHTVLCIAHRISTVMTSDRVCVVDGGLVAELGPPKELVKQDGSRFQRLAQSDASR